MKRFLQLCLLLSSALGAACSSTAEGDVSCNGGVCEPKPVFASGILTASLVTADAVYVAEQATCGVFVADKGFRVARLLTREACNVASFSATKRGLFWSLVPTDREAKGTLAWLPEGATRAVIIDNTLAAPRSTVALGEDVYVAVEDGIMRLAADATKLERVVTNEGPYAPTALRAFGGALYFHDGYATIFTWRPGDAKPRALVEQASVINLTSGSTRFDEPFAVDASGLYWLQQKVLEGGWLAHAPLQGGKPEQVLELPGVPKALAVDEGAVYWTEADSSIFPKETKIFRSAKSALGTFSVIGAIVGDAHSLQIAPEGLYISASPSLTDFDFQKIGFKRYGGPLLILPRGVLDSR